MASISIGLNPAELSAIQRVLSPQQYRQANFQATRRTTRTGRIMAGDVVRGRLTLRKKFIDAPNSEDAAIRDRFDRSTQTGRIVTTDAKLPLSEFRYTDSRSTGVTVHIDNQREALRLRHAFSAQVGSSLQRQRGQTHKGIWMRKNMMLTIAAWTRTNPLARRIAAAAGDEDALAGLSNHQRVAASGQYGPTGYAWRTPLVEQRGPTVYDFVTKTEVLEPLVQNIHNLYRQNFENQISRFTDGRVRSIAALTIDTGDNE